MLSVATTIFYSLTLTNLTSCSNIRKFWQYANVCKCNLLVAWPYIFWYFKFVPNNTHDIFGDKKVLTDESQSPLSHSEGSSSWLSLCIGKLLFWNYSLLKY